MSEMCIHTPCRSSCEHYRHGELEWLGHPGLLNTWITTELTLLAMTADRDNTRLLSGNHVKEYTAKRVRLE